VELNGDDLNVLTRLGALDPHDDKPQAVADAVRKVIRSIDLTKLER
jgi:hypothetical protein